MQELGSEFVRIDPSKEGFNIFESIRVYLGTLNNCPIN